MNGNYQSTKVIELGSCAFRQWRADHSHCKYIHGYQLKAKLWFGCNRLDDKNWCVDFGGLKELKQHLQSLFDHTTTVALDDPELATFKELDKKGIIQLRVFEDGVGIEKVAQVVFDQASDFINYHSEGRCWVDKVEVFEHEDNSASYSEPCCFDEPEEELTTETQPLEQAEVKVTRTVVKDEDVPKKEAPKKEAPKNTKRKLRDLPGNGTKTKGNWFKGTTWG